MDHDVQPGLNAEQLERALAETRRSLCDVADEDQRTRRELAIEQVSRYAALLREAQPGSARYAPAAAPFSFKLEFPDGRWNVEEKELPAAPRVGDVVAFDDGRPWRVRACQLVRPRPAHKPPREFFVCAPAA